MSMMHGSTSRKVLPVEEGANSTVLLLDRGFQPGYIVSALVDVHKDTDQFRVDLKTGHEMNSDIAIHINPRFNKNEAVLNTRRNGVWETEVKPGMMNLERGTLCEMVVVCHDGYLELSINDEYWCSFKHRMPPSVITHVAVHGDITIKSITYNYGDKNMG